VKNIPSEVTTRWKKARKAEQFESTTARHAFTHRLRPGWNEGILKSATGRYGGVMAPLQQTIKAVIRAGDEVGYVAECMEIAVVTQGRTLDETVKHLQEATALHLEGEHVADFGLREKPTLVLTMELDPAHAQAS
jgi:predicted RNase H-like HicB family nuclease